MSFYYTNPLLSSYVGNPSPPQPSLYGPPTAAADACMNQRYWPAYRRAQRQYEDCMDAARAATGQSPTDALARYRLCNQARNNQNIAAEDDTTVCIRGSAYSYP